MDALPPYRLKESRKAKYVRLQITPHEGLVVVVPHGYNPAGLPEMLHRKRNWITRTLEQVKQWQAAQPPPEAVQLPEKILLQAIHEEWAVDYEPLPARWISLAEGEPCRLHLRGNTGNVPLGQKVLRKWLIRKAERHLLPWLQQVSAEAGLPFKKAAVRSQRTRWGSCSRQKHVSLNQKLLFVPDYLVRSVFIHELCHTVHMNHSSHFWKLAQEKEPRIREWDRQLNVAWRELPRWCRTA